MNSYVRKKRLILRWRSLPCGTRNGVVTSYEIKMNRNGVTMVHNTRSRMSIYGNFHVGQQFTVQVRAVNAKGVGPYSHLHEGIFGQN